MNFIGDLNEAARVETNVLTRKQLKDAAIELRAAIDALGIDATDENARAFNAAWVRAVRILKRATPPVDPRPFGAGVKPQEALAA